MKLLSTVFFLLFVSFASAQDAPNDLNSSNSSIETEKASDAKSNTVVISVRGIKTMEEIDIENYNKSTYIKMISTQKRKSKIS
ncbi:hypothetical protein ES677_06465 [Bizionia gelidisalsuginis]|uniref:TonB-dependent receptor plug domain-containing protein n=2 Tax=Bizionia TaxID=283785 RepID=A0A8H2LHP0_9FLAO|nr:MULTISPECIES: hypothetical protein [Bizionia]TYB76625.1 hypothetical protein ES676_04585 [Bizionia saleffrena]TYC14182.1 hypothetical protein ES677_06465 [Bizionia gelidisalsuginis]